MSVIVKISKELLPAPTIVKVAEELQPKPEVQPEVAPEPQQYTPQAGDDQSAIKKEKIHEMIDDPHKTVKELSVKEMAGGKQIVTITTEPHGILRPGQNGQQQQGQPQEQVQEPASVMPRKPMASSNKEIVTSKKSKKKDWDPNPWAVCHTTVDKKKNPEKFEKCVQDIKKKQASSTKMKKSAQEDDGGMEYHHFDNDDLAEYNNNEQDDYRNEGVEDFEEEYDVESGDIATEDHNKWFQYGKLYFVGDEAGLLHKMEEDQFFPNVFFISDHGNAHLVDLSKHQQHNAPPSPPNDYPMDHLGNELNEFETGENPRQASSNWSAHKDFLNKMGLKEAQFDPSAGPMLPRGAKINAQEIYHMVFEHLDQEYGAEVSGMIAAKCQQIVEHNLHDPFKKS